MIIDKALRRRIKKLLPKNYRKTIVERLKEQGKLYHPNTIRNVLNGSPNLEVALEILKLYNEEKKSLQRFKARAGAIVVHAGKPAAAVAA